MTMIMKRQWSRRDKGNEENGNEEAISTYMHVYLIHSPKGIRRHATSGQKQEYRPKPECDSLAETPMEGEFEIT